MRLHAILFVSTAVALLACAACAHGAAHGDAALLAQASIPFDRAQSIALAARPGEVKEWEIERERGGSGVRYSFDIQVGADLYEVGVDANDGAVLENGPERD